MRGCSALIDPPQGGRTDQDGPAGRAEVGTPTSLRRANSWILDLGDDYAHVVVGTPSRKYAWILARSTSLTAATWDRVQKILLGAGYDPTELVLTRQMDLSRK